MIHFLRVSVILVAIGPLAGAAPAQSNHYGLQYDLTLKPEEDLADVSITLSEHATKNIWSIRLHIDPERHTGFEADGELKTDGEYVYWSPPAKGGRLSYHVPLSHRRSNGKFDARMTEDWALFRGDDLFPPAETGQRDSAEADATLHVHLPEGWSFVTAYPQIEKNVYEIEHLHRSFDRPTGWMAAGHLGVRREKIAGVQVIVAGPMNQGVRRMDIMAMLNWNLPRFRAILPDLPKRLLIVSANDPMWRGGLSGPNSLFLHADRALVSENGTSTLVHELMHVANRLKAEKGGDWIVEGIAEYYSLKIMWRSDTITGKRFQEAFKKLEKWAQEADRLDVNRSHGPITARAVGVLRKLDHEIYAKTKHKKSLDNVVRQLSASSQKVSLKRLRQAVLEVMGEPADAISDEHLGLDDGDR